MPSQTIHSKIVADIIVKGKEGFAIAGAEASKSMSRASNSVDKSLKNINSNMLQLSFVTTAFAATMAAAFKGMSDKFIEFDKNMAIVKSVTDASAKTFGVMTEKAIELGTATGFGAAKTAEAMLVISRMGFRTNEMFNVLTPTVKFAASQQEDFAESARLVGSTLRAFNLDASEASRVANVMAATASKSAADLKKLQVSMQFVAPIARTMGVSLEQTSASLGLLFNAGLRASRAGTALRFALGNLENPVGRARKAMVRLGLDMDKLSPSTNDLNDVFQELTKIFQRSDRPAKEFIDIFGRRASSAMAFLANTIREDSDAFTKMMINVSDTTEASRQFEIQMDSLAGQVSRIKAKFDAVSVTLGESLAPAAKVVANTIEDILNAVLSAPKPLKKFASGALALATALATIIAALTTLGYAITAVKVGFAALGATTLAAAAPYIALAAAVGALVIGIGKLIGQKKRLEAEEEKRQLDLAETAQSYIKVKESMEKLQSQEAKKEAKIKLEGIAERLIKLNSDLVEGLDESGKAYILNEDAVKKYALGLGDLTGTSEEAKNKHEQLVVKAKEAWDEQKSRVIALTKEVKIYEKALEDANEKAGVDRSTRKQVRGIIVTNDEFAQNAALIEWKKEQEKLNEEIKKSNQRYLEYKELIEKTSKSTGDAAEEFDNLDEKMGKAGDSVDKLKDRFNTYVDQTTKSIDKFNNEAETLGLTGYQAEIKRLNDAEEAEELSLNNRLRTIKRFIEKNAKDEVEKNKYLMLAEQNNNVALTKLHARYNKARNKSNIDYYDKLKKMDKDHENKMSDILSTTNNLWGAGLEERLSDLNNEFKRERDAAVDHANEMLKIFTDDKFSEERIKIYKDLLDKLDLLDKKYAAEKEKAFLDNSKKLDDINVADVELRENNELKAAKEILSIRKEYYDEIVKAGKQATDEGQAALMDMLQAEKRVKKERIDLAVDSINIINEVVGGAIGELAGLEEEGQRVFASLSNALIAALTGNPILAAVSVGNIIAQTVLNNKKAIEEEAKHREELHKKQIQYVEELDKKMVDLNRGLNNTSTSVDDVIAQMSEFSNNLTQKFKDAGIQFADIIGPAVQSIFEQGGTTSDLRSITSNMNLAEQEAAANNVLNPFYHAIAVGTKQLQASFGLTEDAAYKLAVDLYRLDTSTADHSKAINGILSEYESLEKVYNNLQDTFDNTDAFDKLIASFFDLADQVDDTKRSMADASAILSAAETRRDMALSDAVTEQDVKKAWDTWAETVRSVLEHESLRLQVSPQKQAELDKQLDNLADSIEAASERIFQQIFGPIEKEINNFTNLLGNLGDSISDSFGSLNTLYDMGAISFEEYMNRMSELGKYIDNLPEEIDLNFAEELNNLKIDAVVDQLNRVTNRLSDIKSSLDDSFQELRDVNSQIAEIYSRRASRSDTSPYIDPMANPALAARQAIEGLSDNQKIQKLKAGEKVSIAAIREQIEGTDETIETLRETLSKIPSEARTAIEGVFAAALEESKEAEEESMENQKELFEERHRLLTDFAFAESQNERSNRMRRIRELDKSIAEEKEALDERIADIKEKSDKLAVETSKKYQDMFVEANRKIGEAIEKRAELEDDILEVQKKTAYEVGQLWYQQYLDAKKDDEDLKELLEKKENIHARIVTLFEKQNDELSKQKTLQSDLNSLNEEKINIINNGLIDETRLRANIVNNLMKSAETVQKQINDLSAEQLATLMKNEDAWESIKSITGDVAANIAAATSGAVNIVGGMPTQQEKETNAINRYKALAKLAGYTDEVIASEVSKGYAFLMSRIKNFEQYFNGQGIDISNIPGLAVGGIVKKPTLIAAAERGKPEVIAPLDRLPDLMEQIANRTGFASMAGRTVVVNFNDTIDLRGSVGAMNNPSDVDRFYRENIIPAKRRNIERYRNTITEVIQ